ncbi:MAG: hypothetical protein QXZ12_06875 [Thermoplasmata archaeon]
MEDLELKDLCTFHGSVNYYSVMGVNVTDGIHYIMSNGYSWFVTDFLACVYSMEKLQKEKFLTGALKIDLKHKTAVIVITDCNNHVLYTQEYDNTDAKKDLLVFFTNNVLLLASECWRGQ